MNREDLLDKIQQLFFYYQDKKITTLTELEIRISAEVNEFCNVLQDEVKDIAEGLKKML